MSRINSSDETINKRLQRLSKWKMKTLSIGGRLTLLKSVLGSIPIYYMSMYKVSIHVLRKMESIRSHFFNGADPNTRKMALIKWDNVLVIKAIHGEDGKLDKFSYSDFSSNWVDIVRDISLLKNKGIDLVGLVKKNVGNGENTKFWVETWKGDAPF
ncbi:hypothetical protein Tco_0197670, partial [Tanacetum coccineum]